MDITKAQQLANLSGVPYVRLAGTPFATVTTDGYITAKKTTIEQELTNNWYNLDISAEKLNIGQSSSSETFTASDDALYEKTKEFKGDGMLKTIHKGAATYIEDTFHNQRVDIAFYNSKTNRCAVVYDVVFTTNIQLVTQDSASMAYAYSEKGDNTTIQDTWTLLELVTADNLPIVQTLQAEDDGVATAGLLGKINSVGTGALGIVGTVSAAGFVMSTTNNPPTTADTVVDGTRVVTGYMFKDAVAAAAGTWYVRAYATNAAGTAYGSTITMITT